MSAHIECPREQDVLELVAMEQWPRRADQDLRAHVATCATCGDLAAAASAIVELRETTATDVRVPDARVVWYRAQMRAREDAERRVARPMMFVQIAAVATVVALVTVWSLGGASGLAGWWQWLRAAAPEASADSIRMTASTALASSSTVIYWVGALLLGWIVVASAVFYVTSLADKEVK